MDTSKIFYAEVKRLIQNHSKEDESKLCEDIKKGVQSARRKLIEANLRFVHNVALNYRNQGISLPDLVQAGNVGLVIAATKFDASKNFKFISFAVWWIRQAILAEIHRAGRLYKIPCHTVDIISKVRKKEFENMSIDEISEATGISSQMVEAALSVSDKHESLDDFVSDASGIGTRVENLKSEDDEKDYYELNKINETINSLPKRDSQIIKMRYGFYDGFCYTLEEIAQKMKITRERVRQLERNIIQKISPKIKSLVRH